VANHKNGQSGARKIEADDLDMPPQTRERTPKRMPTYRVVSEALPAAQEQDPRAQAQRVQSPRVLPPEPTNSGSVSPAKGAAGAEPPRYAGVMSESIARQQTGRLGVPQPPAPGRAIVPQAAAPQALPKSAGAVAPAIPASRAPSQLTEIFEKGVAREVKPAAAAPAPARAAQQQRRRAAREELFEAPEVTVVGSFQGLVAGVVVCAALIWMLFFTPLRAQLGISDGPAGLSNWMRELSAPASADEPAREPRMQPMAAPPGEMSLVGPPTLTSAEIDQILAAYGSPAAGSGQDFYNLGVEYGIDPAYAVAFFIHESSAGTAPGWAGIKSDGSTTHNIGNIICAGYPTCYNRFRDYGSWGEGIEDWYRLLAVEYINGRGVYTVEQIIPIYAPSFENNVPGYIQAVNSLVIDWRAGNLP
jgi:Mannosyl-glycoprotein endo-beta-N-acetylglucosaminidase